MAAPRASAAWSGFGTFSSSNMILTISCICFLSAEALPVTPCLIALGVNSCSGIAFSAIAADITPLDSATGMALETFLPKYRVSIAASVGLYFSIIDRIHCKIKKRRPALG